MNLSMVDIVYIHVFSPDPKLAKTAHPSQTLIREIQLKGYLRIKQFSVQTANKS